MNTVILHGPSTAPPSLLALIGMPCDRKFFTIQKVGTERGQMSPQEAQRLKESGRLAESGQHPYAFGSEMAHADLISWTDAKLLCEADSVLEY